MKALGLICNKPNKIALDFLNNFINYKIFIIIDDMYYDIDIIKNIYTNITFVIIKNDICNENGFINMNYLMKKNITSWEKAIYFFSNIETNYDYIWLLEDDVYFYNEETLINIDITYKNEDLLSNIFTINPNGATNYWHWMNIKINYPPPYYNGMMCIVRLSKNSLKILNNYAKQYKTLFFLEALFPTLIIKNNLSYNNPKVFETIHYRYNFNKNEINKFNLYHPVKNIEMHLEYRTKN